jgi:hypothetical protein
LTFYSSAGHHVCKEEIMPELDEALEPGEVADMLSRVLERKERVILTRQGKTVAALIPSEDLEFLEQHQSVVANQSVREIGTVAPEAIRGKEQQEPATRGQVAKDLDWQKRWDELLAKFRRTTEGMTPEEIEADIAAAYEEVRQERLASGHYIPCPAVTT